MKGRTFSLSRVEIILSLGVIVGLAYMFFLFGFGGSQVSQAKMDDLALATQRSLAEVVAQQRSLRANLREVHAKLEMLVDKQAAETPEESAGLKTELDRLTKSLSVIEARMGEVSRLLPNRKKTAPQEDKKAD